MIEELKAWLEESDATILSHKKDSDAQFIKYGAIRCANLSPTYLLGMHHFCNRIKEKIQQLEEKKHERP